MSFRYFNLFSLRLLVSLFCKLRWGDGLLLLCLGGGAIYAWQRYSSSQENQLTLEITQDGQQFLYSLDEKTTRDLVLKNEQGQQAMLVKIDKRRVWVEESDCLLQYCVLRGAIERIDEWIACLPNKVFIRLLASTDKEPSYDPFSFDGIVF